MSTRDSAAYDMSTIWSYRTQCTLCPSAQNVMRVKSTKIERIAIHLMSRQLVLMQCHGTYIVNYLSQIMLLSQILEKSKVLCIMLPKPGKSVDDSASCSRAASPLSTFSKIFGKLFLCIYLETLIILYFQNNQFQVQKPSYFANYRYLI